MTPIVVSLPKYNINSYLYHFNGEIVKANFTMTIVLKAIFTIYQNKSRRKTWLKIKKKKKTLEFGHIYSTNTEIFNADELFINISQMCFRFLLPRKM